MHLSEVKQALNVLVTQLRTLARHNRKHVEAQFGEILTYMVRSADRLGIDLAASRALRILILEDERIVATDLQESLNAMGYDAYAIAANGAEALAMAREKCPDIVLTDIRINGQVDGIAVAEQLRLEFDAAVIFVSALTDDATVRRARQSQPFAYLVKPVSTQTLKATVELTARQRGRSLSA